MSAAGPAGELQGGDSLPGAGLFGDAKANTATSASPALASDVGINKRIWALRWDRATVVSRNPIGVASCQHFRLTSSYRRQSRQGRFYTEPRASPFGEGPTALRIGRLGASTVVM
jgi:hypothetical protein